MMGPENVSRGVYYSWWYHMPKGHEWKTIEGRGAEVDYFAFEYGDHNGPQCVRCGHSFCEHCDGPDDLEPCPNAKGEG